MYTKTWGEMFGAKRCSIELDSFSIGLNVRFTQTAELIYSFFLHPYLEQAKQVSKLLSLVKGT